MRRAGLAAALALAAAAPASAHDIHADPAVLAKLLRAGTSIRKCAPSCHRTRALRAVALRWTTGCNLTGDEILHHWETGLRTALDPAHRTDPATFGSAPFFVDGDATPAAGAEPQDDLFKDAPETLAAFADRTPKPGAKLRVGVKPGSVIAPHIAASCLTTEDGDSSPLTSTDGKVLTVPPAAKLSGAPARSGGTSTLTFDLSVNAASLIRTRGAGSSGAVLHATGAHRALSVADVRAGRTTLRVPAGRVRAWITLSGVRSANTLHLG